MHSAGSKAANKTDASKFPADIPADDQDKGPPSSASGIIRTMNYCSMCGHPIERRTPAGDHLPRHICSRCGHIHYENPKVVAGCIPTLADQVLLCRRAIEPRRGYWTFPAGYLELGETSRAGAAREALEETGVSVDVGPLFAIISVPRVSQIYMVHRATALSAKHHSTSESLETALMYEREIPWGELAFPTIYHSLRFFFSDRAAGLEGFHWLDLEAVHGTLALPRHYVARDHQR